MLRRWVPVCLAVLMVMSLTNGLALAKDSKARQPQVEWISPQNAPAISSLPGATVTGEQHMTTPDPNGTAKPTEQATPPKAVEPMMPICYYGGSPTQSVEGGTVTPAIYDGQQTEEEYQYVQTNQYVDWESALRGVARLDNRLNTGSVTLTYTQGESGTHTMSTQYSKSVSASIKLWLINASGSAGYSTTETWSWSSSTQVSASMTVPGGKVGYIYSYNAAVVTQGDVWYHVYEWYWDDITCTWEQYYVGDTSYPISSSVPTQGYYSYKTVLADS